MPVPPESYVGGLAIVKWNSGKRARNSKFDNQDPGGSMWSMWMLEIGLVNLMYSCVSLCLPSTEPARSIWMALIFLSFSSSEPNFEAWSESMKCWNFVFQAYAHYSDIIKQLMQKAKEGDIIAFSRVLLFALQQVSHIYDPHVKVLYERKTFRENLDLTYNEAP